jgi:hypothetical protein
LIRNAVSLVVLSLLAQAGAQTTDLEAKAKAQVLLKEGAQYYRGDGSRGFFQFRADRIWLEPVSLRSGGAMPPGGVGGVSDVGVLLEQSREAVLDCAPVTVEGYSLAH